jgi:hypothetical protein
MKRTIVVFSVCLLAAIAVVSVFYILSIAYPELVFDPEMIPVTGH